MDYHCDSGDPSSRGAIRSTVPLDIRYQTSRWWRRSPISKTNFGPRLARRSAVSINGCRAAVHQSRRAEDLPLRNSSGSLAMLAAIKQASVSSKVQGALHTAPTRRPGPARRTNPVPPLQERL
jgi:hypothetical protein